MLRDAGDIIDRYTIAKLKAERIGTEENKKEYEAFKKEANSLFIKHPDYDWVQISKFMYDVNNFIWILESGLKSGKEELPIPEYLLAEGNKEGLAKVGLISMLVRNFNHLRVSFKNIINKLVHEGWQDVKKNHLSE